MKGKAWIGYMMVLIVGFLLGYVVSDFRDGSVPAFSDENVDSARKSSSSRTDQEIEPFVMKGRVTDSQGRPIEGVEIFADNQLLYNSNLITYTDEDGYYRIDMPEINTTWGVGGRLNREFDGRKYTFDLVATVDRAFPGNSGAIRNFVWGGEGITGMVVVYTWDYSYSLDDGTPFLLEDVELTLTPVSPLIDGSEGQVIKGKLVNFPDGTGLQTVPIASYEITARWMPEGIEPIPMHIAIRNTEQYAESVTTSFEPVFVSSQWIELQVKFP